MAISSRIIFVAATMLTVLATSNAAVHVACKPADQGEPIIAALEEADGKEMVLRPSLAKLAAAGLKWHDLEKDLRFRRVVQGDWRIYSESAGKQIDLSQLGKIEVRKLE